MAKGAATGANTLVVVLCDLNVPGCKGVDRLSGSGLWQEAVVKLAFGERPSKVAMSHWRNPPNHPLYFPLPSAG